MREEFLLSITPLKTPEGQAAKKSTSGHEDNWPWLSQPSAILPRPDGVRKSTSRFKITQSLSPPSHSTKDAQLRPSAYHSHP